MSMLPGRFIGFVLLILLAAVSHPSPADVEEAPPVVLLAAEAVEENLHLTLLWNEEYPFRDPTVVLRNEEGSILATQSVEPSGTVAVKEVLEGALSDLWESGFSLVAEVQDDGVVVGDTLPFFAPRECDPDPCSWQLLVGLEADALVTTSNLHELLEVARRRYTTCDLGFVLNAIEQEEPQFYEEVQHAKQQVETMQIVPGGSGGCSYAWHAVVETNPTGAGESYQEHSTDQGVIDSEEGGFQNGAAYHHGAQVRRLSAGATYLSTTVNTGTTSVTLDLQCAGGTAACLASCQGQVVGILDYEVSGRAHSDVYAQGGSASAWAWEEMILRADGMVQQQQVLSVVSLEGHEEDQGHHTASATLPEPATFGLETTHQLVVSASYQPGSFFPHIPEQGAAHAYADLQNQYTLTVDGTAPLCPGVPTANVTLGSPPFRQAITWKEQGGLRIEKWQDPFILPF